MRFIVIWMVLLGLVGCSPHVIATKTGISRDTTYIEFASDSSPFVFEGVVGGEHTTSIVVLGFEGEDYLIELLESDDNVSFYVSSDDGATIVREGTKVRVEINAAESFVQISFNAHPDAGSFVVRVQNLTL